MNIVHNNAYNCLYLLNPWPNQGSYSLLSYLALISLVSFSLE